MFYIIWGSACQAQALDDVVVDVRGANLWRTGKG